ncbi:MAG: beta-galactosidase, partial [Cyclobacteriaceae bacterium]|nr:beta-galactosidase [Cyclobacteriaceae bacterium]
MTNKGLSFLLFILVLISGCSKDKISQMILFDPDQAIPEQLVAFGNDPLNFEDGFVKVKFTSGEPVSTIAFKPLHGVWDASGFRFVRCEIYNDGPLPQMAELGFGNYDLTLGATLIPSGGKKVLRAIIYRTDHPVCIDEAFPVMHGKPDGTLRGWMASTCDSIEYIKLIFPELKEGNAVRIGKIWLEEPYELLSAEELKRKYYPFVDEFGQYIHASWPGKIKNIKELDEKEREENKLLERSPGNPEWNEYGGWNNGPQLEATGRFRVEKYDGNWWLVDPLGKLFWSNGLDCVEFGTQTQTRITGWEHFFRYLPENGTPEASNFGKRVFDDDDSLKTLSFHRLNLYRKYGASWRDSANSKIHRRMRSWGINTIGNWSDAGIYLIRKTPYVLTAYSPKFGIIADPYTAGFQDEIENTLRSKTDELCDPWCVGVFIDNELKWGVKWSSKIPEQILTASEDQPAKIAFVKRMKNKYVTIGALNSSWKTSFENWKELQENKQLISGATKDMEEFMKEFTASYYSKCRDAVKKADPEMLYLGCRMDFHLYPEDTSLNYIIRIASEYCDVVSFNRYRYTCSELVPPDHGDYPIIIGEFHFGSLETGLLQPGLRYAADQVERAEFYDHYVRSALQNPFIVGTHW